MFAVPLLNKLSEPGLSVSHAFFSACCFADVDATLFEIRSLTATSMRGNILHANFLARL